jgi:hypothetical protein
MAWQQARLEAMSDSPKEPASEEPGISWLKKDQGSTNSLNVATGTVKQAMQTEKGMWNAVFRGDLADLQKLVAAQGPDILYEVSSFSMIEGIRCEDLRLTQSGFFQPFRKVPWEKQYCISAFFFTSRSTSRWQSGLLSSTQS